jgi:hypothetical protein
MLSGNSVSDVEDKYQEFNKLLAEYEGISVVFRSLLNSDELTADDVAVQHSKLGYRTGSPYVTVIVLQFL